MPPVRPGERRLGAFAEARVRGALSVLSEQQLADVLKWARWTPIWELTIVVRAVDGIHRVMPPAYGIAAMAAHAFVHAEFDLLAVEHQASAGSEAR